MLCSSSHLVKTAFNAETLDAAYVKYASFLKPWSKTTHFRDWSGETYRVLWPIKGNRVLRWHLQYAWNMFFFDTVCHISDTLGCALCATFLFLPHFDVICDLLLNRRTATWNLFVKSCSLLRIKKEKNGVLVVRGNRAPHCRFRERKRYHCTTRNDG